MRLAAAMSPKRMGSNKLIMDELKWIGNERHARACRNDTTAADQGRFG
jgi:hypothetical protein